MVNTEPFNVNVILREMQVLAEEMGQLEKQRDAINRTIDKHRKRYNGVTTVLIGVSDRAEKLMNAADALERDWRDWPWVREAGLHTQFPKKTN